ncbi:uncharacterized protein EDB91DRAFT_365919 [Suillus paluster]|uniref:uncharacterized protein n=1 Tax=Suillus paluster TaxID=48578 RepID=UPI001B86205C|nr:uncharacterized protein EDB91DRAFT_365919 [Suillus paluster]KAG1740235.1 hypothetical protein EDB91DRAFT_365919 [Suillus paluster]
MSNHSQLELWRQTPQDKRLTISSIRVTAPATGLRRIPAGFYVAVEIDRTLWRTAVKAEVPSSKVVQWDQIFVLPTDNSAIVSLRICAAFEFERMLGRGELMHEAQLTVGELLHHSNHFLPILFSHAGESTSLLVTVDRGPEDEPGATQFGQRYSPGSEDSQFLGQMTETGQNLLACYRRTRCISDYHAATEQLRLTLGYCGSDHPDRAAALTNLADVLAIHPHIEESDYAINAPISLYQEALELRRPGHADRSLALLKLGLALLYRFQIRKNPADVMAGQELLNRAQGVCSDDNADIKPVFDAIRSATSTSTSRSHCSSPAPPSPSPSSPLSQMPMHSTPSQPHKFPEALGRTADLSTRSAPLSMRSVNGESLPQHGHAEQFGDEKGSATVFYETKAPLAACQSTHAPSRPGTPYTNSVTKPPKLPPGTPHRECNTKLLAPAVEMRVMQPQQAKSVSSPLTPSSFLPLPVPAAQAPDSFISKPCIALIAGGVSLSILLLMTCPSHGLWL